MTTTDHKTFVLVPGAWMGAWLWDDLAAELRARGHDVHALTLTGLDAGRPLSPVDIRLETHVQDVITYIQKQTLTDLTLVGHSYAGVVAGLVADRRPEVISRLAFVEAILPIDGQSMLESGGNDVQAEIQHIRGNDGLWPHPTSEELSGEEHLSDSQRQHLLDNLVDHPGHTVTDVARVRHRSLDVPTLFIGQSLPETAASSAFQQIRHEPLNGGHWPMLTKPKQLASALSRD